MFLTAVIVDTYFSLDSLEFLWTLSLSQIGRCLRIQRNEHGMESHFHTPNMTALMFTRYLRSRDHTEKAKVTKQLLSTLPHKGFKQIE